MDHAQSWAIRSVHEAQTAGGLACSLTLTYDDEDLPEPRGLDLSHWQKFAKKLRKHVGPFRFLHCGEYGDESHREHFHACLFGVDLRENATPHTNRLWINPMVTDTWGKGFCPIGNLTFETASYVARYVMKKINGDLQAPEYGDCKPPYATMSRRPGLGRLWIERYWQDVYPCDFVVLPNGNKARPPRYYDSWLETNQPAMHARVLAKRAIKTADNSWDYTATRLQVQDQVEAARASLHQHRNAV